MGLTCVVPLRKAGIVMTETPKPAKPTREERLAQQLRDNLRRRKGVAPVDLNRPRPAHPDSD
jgi:hypothetical protein